MKKTTTAALVLASLVLAAPAYAQESWAFELRGNGSVPTRDLGEDELERYGVGFEGTLQYRLQPHLWVYGGWDWAHFQAEQSFAGPDMDFEETGYVLGLRFEHPIRGETSGPAWWLRAGGTLDHIELEDDDGEIVADSGHGLGWEAAAGVAVPVGSRWSFTPGLRYRALSRDVEIGSTTTEVDLEYVALELGILRRF